MCFPLTAAVLMGWSPWRWIWKLVLGLLTVWTDLYFIFGKYLCVCSWKAENMNRYLLFIHCWLSVRVLCKLKHVDKTNFWGLGLFFEQPRRATNPINCLSTSLLLIFYDGCGSSMFEIIVKILKLGCQLGHEVEIQHLCRQTMYYNDFY